MCLLININIVVRISCILRMQLAICVACAQSRDKGLCVALRMQLAICVVCAQSRDKGLRVALRMQLAICVAVYCILSYLDHTTIALYIAIPRERCEEENSLFSKAISLYIAIYCYASRCYAPVHTPLSRLSRLER